MTNQPNLEIQAEALEQIQNKLEKFDTFYYGEYKKAEKLSKGYRDLIKDRFIKIKNDILQNPTTDEEFDFLRISNFILREVRKSNWHYKQEAKEELIYSGYFIETMQASSVQKKKYDLSNYELPHNPKKDYIQFKDNDHSEEKSSMEKVVQSKLNEANDKQIEELVSLYSEQKELLTEADEKYQQFRKELLELMRKANIQETPDGTFKIHNERTQYDLRQIYGITLEERVEFVVSSDRQKCYDIIEEKISDLTLDDLKFYEPVNRRFGVKKKEIFKEALGEGYFFIEGYRDVDGEEFLLNCDVKTGEVEKLINKNSLSSNFLKNGRVLLTQDDVRLDFEITTEESIQKRGEVFHQMFMSKAARLQRIRDFDKEQLKINQQLLEGNQTDSSILH